MPRPRAILKLFVAIALGTYAHFDDENRWPDGKMGLFGAITGTVGISSSLQ